MRSTPDTLTVSTVFLEAVKTADRFMSTSNTSLKRGANNSDPLLSRAAPQPKMIRRIIRGILRLALRVYFRRIEVTGLENVPRESPVIFVLNHPNALVDPTFLLCLAPRRVAFVAKAPLFRMPVIGYLVRALDSLPAYRRQDEDENVGRNLETFAAARKLLASGGTGGICPEGAS